VSTRCLCSSICLGAVCRLAVCLSRPIDRARLSIDEARILISCLPIVMTACGHKLNRRRMILASQTRFDSACMGSVSA
jgi:hypothetical protein